MGLPNETTITIWDVINYSLFDRDVAMFDVLTFIIVFIDGVTIKKPVALCLILHWLFRSIGGIVGAIIMYLYQTDAYQWRFFQSYPTIFWYAGELLLDSYPFQKAWAVASGNPKYRILALIGFVPLLVVKTAVGAFRYIDPLFVDPLSMSTYYLKFNPLDATVFVLSAWSDMCCCVVIVAVSARWFHRWRARISGFYHRTLKRLRRGDEQQEQEGAGNNVSNRNGTSNYEYPPPDEFLDSLVITTEVRMIVCTVLAVTCATLIFLKDTCEKCEFGATARVINIDYVYCLYYLDYLVLKYRKTELISSNDTDPNKNGMFSPNPSLVGNIVRVGMPIGVQSSAASLDAKTKGGMTTDESVVYGKYDSDQTSGSAYYLDDLDNKGKKDGR